MYYIQDVHSFWDWIYFVFLIVIGSFFLINLCLVVIATQFSETKKRETERMLNERRRFSRTSSARLSDEQSSCWADTITYLEYLWKQAYKKMIISWKNYRNNQTNVRLKYKILRIRLSVVADSNSFENRMFFQLENFRKLHRQIDLYVDVIRCNISMIIENINKFF